MGLIPSARLRCVVVASTVTAASLLSLNPAPAAPAPQVKTFDSGGMHLFTVPQGVSEIQVVAVGAGGGGGGGGGNNGGPLSGGGGSGGGGAARVSCRISVQGGSTLYLEVGEGGIGGKGGSGKYSNGDSGEEGESTSVSVTGTVLVSAKHGWQGWGGEGSGNIQSGNGGAESGQGTAEKSWCVGDDIERLSGHRGDRGQDGSRNRPGAGGSGGKPARYPDTCRGAGRGGYGGHGAGLSGGVDPQQEPAGNGTRGNDGCLVLTYAANAASS